MKFSDFGFKENPFAITPDPRYLYLSRGHEESLAHLIYGTGPNGGFVLLTGEVGTGKTLLIRSLLAQHLDNVDIALILNPRLSRREFLAAVCDELGIDFKGNPYSLKQLTDALSNHLLETHGAGRHTVLVVDEAQDLSPRVLEQIRLLTNLETTRHKLLRIILVGQPELLQMLAREDLRQVDQRITARYHLSPLNRQETARYIVHRLAVAGIREDLFTPAAMRLVHRSSGGVPRIINTICERTLLAIFSRGGNHAGPRLVRRAAKEVKGYRLPRLNRRWLAVPLLLAGGIGLYAYLAPQSINLHAPADRTAQTVTPPEPEPAPSSEMAAVEAEKPAAETEAEKSATETETEKPAAETEAEKSAVAATSPAQADVETPPPQAVKTASSSSDAAGDAAITAGAGADGLLPRLFDNSQPQTEIFSRLFALWGETFNRDSPLTPCMQAPARGLRCIREKADWKRLQSLNRPLLFRLVQNKQSRFLLLKRVTGDDRLVVDDGEGERELALSDLDPYWHGEYVMLWRPHGGAALIGDGSAGEPVTWLRERMHQVDGQPLTKVEGLDHFDEPLKSRLQAFQRTHGLMDDGVAGQQTLVFLNNLALPPGTPTLRGDTDQGGS
jgi:general secretion pathway protein A